MPRALLLAAVAALAVGCSQGTERVSGSVVVSSPIEVSSVAAPVEVASVSSPVTVAQVTAPITVADIASPITVAGIATPVTVAGIQGPVTVAAGDTPVVVSLPRPELDPERIETGTWNGATASTCTGGEPCARLIDGPFVLTDVLVRPDRPALFADPPTATLSVRSATDPLAAPRWGIRLDGGGAIGQSDAGGRYVEAAWAPVTITGARLAVRSGESLYVAVRGTGVGVQVLWSGFRP
ncbi:hypothetical protein A2cp1_3680 [Anaeromyxobacter dehalogenans 2CP-1]|uniref:Lipoprotein n=1 Tax=Anaeromyxobacter dehalogenans (strain ATCC BAA-258 / DSM 21875 / 2CP-1) TaxID=455488 RepID=B8J6N5_ANAD2|nr:hypothetical protein [Anaeromyxobacter dehalogenans]ACL67007.1 hypothetical protein A2cp1_3680 [Anaeromyxobacter dehalogenans 2CP-1]